MPKMPFSFFFLLLLCFASTFSSSSAVQRHLLHQPFFPVTSTAPPPSPTLPPAPSPTSHHHHHHKKQSPPPPPPPEKHTFSSVTTPPPSPPHRNPFFPSSDPSSPTSHSPPSPPPPASLPTFPANISSLLFPTHSSTSSSKPHHTRLITITASVISAASILSLLAVFLIYLRRSRHRSTPVDDTKSIRSDSLQLFSGAPSDGSLKVQQQPPKYTSSNTSSEFLYLGTLVNSTSNGLNKSPISNNNNITGVLELPGPASSSSSSSFSQYQKLGSPELRPLPPLPKLPSFTPIYQSSEQLNPKRHEYDGEDEEFYSPRGSSGRKQSFSDVVKDSAVVDQIGSGSNSSSSSRANSVTSLNGSPVVKSSSPPLNRVCPKRPPPPPPPPPALPQFSEIPPATSLGDGNEEKKEESLKPKLKTLHWDKVRASSSRVMVWDQIKSNSFQ